MIVTFLVLVLSFVLLNYYKTKRSLHMMQQNLYNENNRYIKWIIHNQKQFLNIEVIVIIIALFGLVVLYHNSFITMLAFLIIMILIMISTIKWYQLLANDQNKKVLVLTPRIKRLIITIVLLFVTPFIVFLSIINMKSVWVVILIISIMTYLNTLVVFIALLINMPMEKIVYLHFKRNAMAKLNSMQNLKIIGITGSYGKTSCKNVLSDILNIKYNALPTPKNLNTYNGLIMTINNNLDKFTDIFIAEMGAYVKGEIKGLCKLVRPQYGILTTIGTAHLESFGSEENIVDGKFELIESLPNDGFAVLNGDDPKQVNYTLKNKIKKIWIGIDNKDVDIRATNIKCSKDGTEFDVQLKDKEKYHFNTKLLGQHNIYNILSAIACGMEFEIEMSDLIKAVKMVNPVEHRLEMKKLANFYMIDDAYNSNPVGAKNALDVLKMMPGEKIVVTPGMIELGEKEDYYNEIFGEQISKVADLVILIGKNKTIPIKEGLLKKGFDKDKIIVFNDVREAYPIIGKIAINKEVYALFENDLPDTYNE